MTETDPEMDDPPAQVPDDRQDAGGDTAPGGDREGPPAQVPDDRKSAPGSGNQ
ncbi:hypothetical protein FHS43_003333 [Streptosporangium becharense]|uniref:Uncharacterized protein n=1 Tax=Streptosporangium becharense TaxID=1816182 RepID=A0A7W9IDS3_9ACTN|nr:hypothetical protein [Streptosporangium becharense]MBB2912053.1 hypothetical protein [Streptosporangium becharense]MBB5818600.1 hypothetical protein [Streptosporangium becharense]